MSNQKVTFGSSGNAVNIGGRTTGVNFAQGSTGVNVNPGYTVGQTAGSYNAGQNMSGNQAITMNNATMGLASGQQAGSTGFTIGQGNYGNQTCLLYTSPSPRDQRGSRMPSSA